MTIRVDLQTACEQRMPGLAQFQHWATVALQHQQAKAAEQALLGDVELSIRVVDATESEALNSAYRHKKGPTNVLSFPFDSPVLLDPHLLGDLVICASVVEQEAADQNKKSDDHWAHMVVHGCLHLIGFDHIEDDEAEIMEALEVDILKLLSINDPYQEQGKST